MRYTYEDDPETFSAPAYRVRGYGGVAWYVLGWETRPIEDEYGEDAIERSGYVVARMVGDDRHFLFRRDEFKALDREEYCGSCGQIGCSCDSI